FQRLDQVGVPDQRAVGDRDIFAAAPDLVDAVVALGEHLAGTEDGAVLLHHLLHAAAELGGRRAALGVAEAVEARDRLVAGARWQVAVAPVRLARRRGAQGRGAAEDDAVDQRTGAEPAGGGPRHAGAFADR